MSKLGFAVGTVAVVAVAGSASAIQITETAAETRASLTSGLFELNLSGQPIIGLDANPNNNIFTRNFAHPSFSGTLVAEVFGNQANPGSGLNDVVIVYSFTGNGFDGVNNLTAIDAFELGVNTGTSVDFGAISTAAHGRVTDEITPGQGTARVDLFSNVGSNDTFLFDFNSNIAGPSPSDPLGGLEPAGTETFTWYVRVSSGAVAINVVDVTVTDGGVITTQTLAFVDNPGQPDLNVPAPGVLALAGFGCVAGVRRRRR